MDETDCSHWNYKHELHKPSYVIYWSGLSKLFLTARTIRQKKENLRKTKRQVRSIHYKSNNYCYISITYLALPISKFGVTNKQPYLIRSTVILKLNYNSFLLLFLLLFFFFYNPFPSRTRNSRLQLYKNPSSVCQPYIYLLKSERRKWNREIWTKRHKNGRSLHLLFLNSFNVQKEAKYSEPNWPTLVYQL